MKRIIAAATAVTLAFAPAANALPQRNFDATNPTTIGERCANPGDRLSLIHI